MRDDFLNQVEPSRARSSSSDPAYNSQANFEVVLSPAIVDEVLRALGYRKVRRLLPGTDARLWFEDLIVLADVVADRQLSASARILIMTSTWLRLSRAVRVTSSPAIAASLPSVSTRA